MTVDDESLRKRVRMLIGYLSPKCQKDFGQQTIDMVMEKVFEVVQDVRLAATLEERKRCAEIAMSFDDMECPNCGYDVFTFHFSWPSMKSKYMVRIEFNFLHWNLLPEWEPLWYVDGRSDKADGLTISFLFFALKIGRRWRNSGSKGSQ